MIFLEHFLASLICFIFQELDKTLMAELRANYYMLCAQEDEFLKVMQNRKLCQVLIKNSVDTSIIFLVLIFRSLLSTVC